MNRLIAFVLLIGGCAVPLSQTPPAGMTATVTAPEIRVGDTWTYRVRDGYTGLERVNLSYQVTEIGADRIQVAASGEPGDGIQVYDRQWNWLKRPATNLQTFEYSPAYPALAFPLAPGNRWRARVTARDPLDGRRFQVWIDGTVLGWERVKVPAGEFDALKIERIVFFNYWEYAVRDRSEILEYEWYAPAVKQAVRREAQSKYLSYLFGRGNYPRFQHAGDISGDDGGPRYIRDDWLIYELTGYSAR